MSCLPRSFTQVVCGLPGGVAVVAGDRADLGGVLGDGEPARGRGERGGQGRPDPRLVQVDPGDLAGSGLGGTASSSSTPSGKKPMSAVDDLCEVLQAAAAAQLFGVVHGGLQTQHVLALGVGLQSQAPETDPEPAQPVPWFLDHDLLRRRGRFYGCGAAGP